MQLAGTEGRPCLLNARQVIAVPPLTLRLSVWHSLPLSLSLSHTHWCGRAILHDLSDAVAQHRVEEVGGEALEHVDALPLPEREPSLFTTYWSEST